MRRITAAVIAILFGISASAQNAMLDSIRKLAEDDSQTDSTRIASLLSLSKRGYLFSRPDTAFIISAKASSMAKSAGLLKLEEEAVKLQGISLAIRGINSEAIDYFDKSLRINEQLNDSVGIAGSLNNIGLLYKEMDDSEHSLEYLLRSYSMYESLNNLNGKALCSGNIANIYDDFKEFDKALEYAVLSRDFYSELGDPKGIANSISSLGSLTAAIADELALKGQKAKSEELYLEALEYFNESLEMRRQVNDVEGIAITLNGIGEVQRRRKRYKEAKPILLESFKLSNEIGSPSVIQTSASELYQVYKQEGNFEKALEMFVLQQSMQDSLLSDKNQRAIIRQELDHAYDKQALADSLQTFADLQQAELKHQNELTIARNQRIQLIGAVVVFLLLAIGIWSRLQFVRRSKAELQLEKDRSDELLLNILPAEVAQELKENGEAKARIFDLATILFTDFKGFTEKSAQLNPSELVKEVNQCFRAFDLILERYDVEKIKTIGDAYMAVGGLPSPKANAAKNTVLAALEMQDFIINRKKENEDKGLVAFEMRVGIHTGPVVAGIVGVKKFQYDVWGDAVNTASRMENNGEIRQVNISQSTYEIIQDEREFSFEKRGKIEVKGKGEMEMWFVSLAQ
jgi:class 3 adenylate cyclase